jgi:type VI secretion system secreted protein VgrG
MGQITQEHRLISITDFSLGKDTFVITSLSGSEYISGLFEYELELYSDNHQISPDKIVGKSATVTIQNDHKRCFNGFISSFTFGEVGPHNYRRYRMTMVPWLWFLTRTQNCRIFQEKNTKQIVTEVFNELGFSDFEFKASGGKPREYCVQYHESDFQFVSRLLEEEGIAYYFKHTDGQHKLILVDQLNAYEEVKETNLEYSKGNMPNTQIHRWEHFHKFKKGHWTLNDYNFVEPKKDLKTSAKSKSTFANNGKFEHYSYASLYDYGAGADLVKIRLEAEETFRDLVEGASDCSTFYAGGKFKLAKHDTAGERDNYILVSVRHYVTDASFFAGQEGQPEYYNEFVCIPAKVHFRPQPIHEKPLMKGPQSAIVVGPAGEEIYIDEHCRIKVQFYWDRDGKNDENSTCFIRVVQSWAGNQWGASFIPRIGHEVIVNFLDGDPDRPLVTGSVYNGWNKPVYSSKTQSGIKSRSTKGGTAQNFNEFRFEDKKGSEQVYLHAEKDFDTHVENDQSLTVEHDRTKLVKNDETSNIDNDRRKRVGNNQSETIGKNKTISVGKDHSESISDNMTITIGKNLMEKVRVDYTEAVDGNKKSTIGKDLTESVKGNHAETVTKNYSLKAKNVQITAQDEISLKVGSASILMKKNGDITIQGKKINVKGSGDVIIKGSNIKEN